MILGIKTGPKNWEDGKAAILEDSAAMSEIWFNIHNESHYDDMLVWLQEHDVAIGLHHWGVVEEKYKTNLMTNNESVRHETIEQIQRTIDIASTLKRPAYVNAHPGSRYLETLNLDTAAQELVKDSRTPDDESDELFFQSVQYLQEYAASKNIVLTIETLPAAEARLEENRSDIYIPDNAPLSLMKRMTQEGWYIANDITHTAAQLAMENPTPAVMWEKLYAFSRAVAPATRLIHLNTVTPPYNGTDSHTGITEDDFRQTVFPSRDQLKELLHIFKDREDVYVVPEPQTNATRANFKALTQLVSEL
ncbi:MAG: TIM barrel protein [Candidatus Andersenbacteria bacterium]